ncbi:MAG: hypothetical protein ACREJM_13250 [Candidatus Saccharimonadales bacterium]
MIAFKAYFDGQSIIPPEELRSALPSEVIVVVEKPIEPVKGTERDLWLKAQEAGLARVWENDEDAAYDNL